MPPITIDSLEQQKKEYPDDVVELSISELLELIHNTNESKYPELIIKYVGRNNATLIPDLTRQGSNPIYRGKKFKINVAQSKKDDEICVIGETCYFDSQWTYQLDANNKPVPEDSVVDKDTSIFEYIGYTTTAVSKSKTNCEIIEEQISKLQGQLRSIKSSGACKAAASGGKSRKTKRSKSKRGKTRRNKRRSSRRRR